MHDTQNDRISGQIITIYEPIFREKLEKLEQRGQGYCTEAVRLRKTLALLDNARTGLCQDQEDQPLSVAAE